MHARPTKTTAAAAIRRYLKTIVMIRGAFSLRDPPTETILIPFRRCRAGRDTLAITSVSSHGPKQPARQQEFAISESSIGRLLQIFFGRRLFTSLARGRWRGNYATRQKRPPLSWRGRPGIDTYVWKFRKSNKLWKTLILHVYPNIYAENFLSKTKKGIHYPNLIRF